MPVYRGTGQRKFMFKADNVLASKRYSKEHNISVLNGEKTYSRLYDRVTDKTIGVLCDLRGDYLIYGWRPWYAFMALLAIFATGQLIFGIILLIAGQSSSIWTLTWPYGVFGSLLAVYISMFWYSSSPFSHYVVFDRRNKLVHLPRDVRAIKRDKKKIVLHVQRRDDRKLWEAPIYLTSMDEETQHQLYRALQTRLKSPSNQASSATVLSPE